MGPGDRSANTFKFFNSDDRILSLSNEITVKIGDRRQGLKRNNMILGRGSCQLKNIFGLQLDGESMNPAFLRLKIESSEIRLISLGDRISGTVLLRFSTGPFAPLSEREELRLYPQVMQSPGWAFLSPHTGPYALPTEWKMHVDVDGRKYFVDSNTKTLSHKDPRQL
jgi:hypothetical protein